MVFQRLRRRYRLWRLIALADKLDAKMSGVNVNVRQTMLAGSDVATLSTQLNKLILDLELLRSNYVLHQHAALGAAPSTNLVTAAQLLASQLVYNGSVM